MNHLLADFVLLFTVTDPIGVAANFAGLVAGAGREHQRRMALKGTLIAAGILLAFMLGGAQLLSMLGIGIPAFRIAGGLLLLLLSVDMILARHSGLRTTTDVEDEEAANRADISVFPVAFPLIAGPGAITTVLLMASGGAGAAFYVQTIAILALVLCITFVCLLYAPVILGFLGDTGTNVVSRLLGVLLTALAVQYMLDGLKNSLFAG